MTEEQERSLNVRQSGKLLQKGFCFFHTLRHGEGLTVGGGPNGRAKKGEGATGVDLNPFRENPHVDTTVGPPTGDDFALAWVELESNLASSGGEAGKRCSSVTVVTSQTHVIQEGKRKVRCGEPSAGGL